MNWLVQHYSLIVGLCRYNKVLIRLIGGFRKGGCRGRRPETTIIRHPSPAVDEGFATRHVKASHHTLFWAPFNLHHPYARLKVTSKTRPITDVNFGGSNAQVQKNGFALARASAELQADPVPWLREGLKGFGNGWLWMCMTWNDMCQRQPGAWYTIVKEKD